MFQFLLLVLFFPAVMFADTAGMFYELLFYDDSSSLVSLIPDFIEEELEKTPVNLDRVAFAAYVYASLTDGKEREQAKIFLQYLIGHQVMFFREGDS